ncbi:MAG: VacJ family lipoprotein [Betaproteobacteria bacterium]|nr:VacJ family lipoprotein [Betaproteobacteria bacterium]
MKPRSLALLLSLLVSATPCVAEGDPRDPLESFNRGVHGFNEGFDKAIFKPVAEGYKAVMPAFGQTSVRNFFSNLNDVTVLTNDILQLKGEQAIQDFLRLAFNSTFGLLGLLDVSSEMGLRKHDEDFGQTLGRWGMGSGPYLVLPFLGSSSLRDTAGLVVDTVYTDPVVQTDDVSDRNVGIGVRMISKRADLLDAKRTVDEAALDPYEFMRELYLERRRSQVFDGKPPEEKD